MPFYTCGLSGYDDVSILNFNFFTQNDLFISTMCLVCNF